MCILQLPQKRQGFLTGRGQKPSTRTGLYTLPVNYGPIGNRVLELLIFRRPDLFHDSTAPPHAQRECSGNAHHQSAYHNFFWFNTSQLPPPPSYASPATCRGPAQGRVRSQVCLAVMGRTKGPAAKGAGVGAGMGTRYPKVKRLLEKGAFLTWLAALQPSSACTSHRNLQLFGCCTKCFRKRRLRCGDARISC